MIIPDLLKPDDKIGILAPARKISKADVEFASNVFRKWGLQIALSNNLFSSNHSYLSGSDEERGNDLQQMINAPGIKAIVCARGGYGSTRIVDDIDFSPLLKYPKWIIGFSDITAIHLKLLETGVASIHATMPILFAKEGSKISVQSLQQVLMSGHCKINFEQSEYNKQGGCNGIVMGGNLSLITDSLGTSTEPDTNNKILIIEEIDEYLYKIDRMMTQLRRSGKLRNLAGLIVGHMTDIRDSELSFGQSVEKIILNAVRDYNYPVAFKFPSGHENPNLAWIHGGTANLQIKNDKVELSFENVSQ